MTLYASTAQIKAALRITDTVDDTLISIAGSAASELIDLHCGRTFGTASATRYYAPDSSCFLRIDDLAGTALTLESSSNGDGTYDTTWATTDYQLQPLNARRNGITWPYDSLRAIGDNTFPVAGGEATVRVTGVFGWPAVPAAVVEAAMLQSSRLFKRFESPLGVAGGNDFGAMRVTRSVDPDVAVLLADFRDGVKAAGGIS